MKTDQSPFEVFIRIRPVFAAENPKKSVQVRNPCEFTKELALIEPITNIQKIFTYTGVFSEKFSNTEIYSKTLQKLIPRLTEGYNTTCFAYGNTGSGKTHTMFGHGSNINSGLAYLSIKDCFRIIPSNAVIKLSLLEIYNETIIDLLVTRSKSLMIVEDPVKGVVVPELSEFVIKKIEDANELIQKGNKNRARAATFANEFSTSSERAASTENKGMRMKEGANINRSLLALGNCINILSDFRKKGAYVPFRDSKLTRLLKESLGGNSKTVMIACISPLQSAYEDTSQTLKYASRAKNISNISVKVVKTTDYLEIINSLKSEIEILKVQLSKDSNNNPKSPTETVDSKILSQNIITNFEEH